MWFRQLPIKSKFLYSILVVVIVQSIFLLLAIQNQITRLEKETIEQNRNLVNILSQDLTRIVVLGSVDDAADVSTRLDVVGVVNHLFLYNKQNKVVFGYHRQGLDATYPPDVISESGYQFINNEIRLIMPLIYAGVNYGNAYISSPLDALNNKIRVYKDFAVVSLALMMMLFFFLTKTLNDGVITPIAALTTSLSNTTSRKFYNKRFHTNYGGEIGKLYDGINRLLTEIESSHTLLLNTNVSLEQRVKQRTDEMYQALTKAEHATSAKSNFLANMSHEIRTPMNGVMGMIDLLRSSELDIKQKEYAELAYNSAETLLVLLNDILDISKIEEGKLEFEKIDFNISKIIEDSASLYAHLAHNKGLEITCMIDDAVPDSVIGDPTRFRQIINNIISNAVKFTQRGEVSVAVYCVMRTDRYTDIRCIVSDTGVGISTEAQKTIFENFTQADVSTTRNYGGSGLGLGISYRLTKLLDGDITVSSTPGQGSHFLIDLRFDISNVKTDMADIPASFNEIRALVVDDNETSRQIISKYLSQWGINFKAVGNGKEAMALLSSYAQKGESFNLILLDMVMPDMDGLDVIKSMEAESLMKGMDIIVLSSSLNESSHKQVIEKGVSFWMLKPLRKSTLFDAMVSLGSSQDKQQAVSDEIKPTSEVAVTGKKPSILVVEDNIVNMKLSVAYLESMGLSSDTAVNGALAVDAVAIKKYDLIFMDCNMPVMDGYEATDIIHASEKEADQHTPIIAMTANAMLGDEQRCLDAGMDGYISKPIKVSVLEDILKKWLDYPSS